MRIIHLWILENAILNVMLLNMLGVHGDIFNSQEQQMSHTPSIFLTISLTIKHASAYQSFYFRFSPLNITMAATNETPATLDLIINHGR